MEIIKFVDVDTKEIHYGIRLPDGDIMCACCGGTFEQDEIQILDAYRDDFEESIKELGGWL